LLGCFGAILCFGAPEKLHHPKLFVSYFENDYFAGFRQKAFHPPFMYFGILVTGAMSGVDGVLDHSEAITQKTFTEQGVRFPVLFCFRGQIEVHKNPHDPVLI
jgi:hypothetical protein